MAPVMESIETKQNKAKVEIIDVDLNRELASKFDVKGIPTIVILKDGKEVDRVNGMIAEQYLMDKIDEHF